jgi:hypothetical protein
MFMMRLAVATGCSRVGGVETFGSASLCHALVDHLPGLHQVGSRLEQQVDRRYAGHGFRIDRLEPWHADQQIGFQRHRDQRFDFRCRQADCLGSDLQCQRREFRHDIQGHLAHLPKSPCQQHRRNRDDHGSKAQAAHDDLFH